MEFMVILKRRRLHILVCMPSSTIFGRNVYQIRKAHGRRLAEEAPAQSMRDFGVRVKLNPVKELLKNKDIIIIEDSIIRGTTVKTRVKALREFGVKRVHMRVSSPPHRFPCHYGIDFSTKGELIAANKSIEELRDLLGLDSLHYISLDGLLKSTGMANPENNFCKACFDGCYPVEFDESLSKDCLEM